MICVGEGWGLFSEEEPHGLALVPYVGGVAYGAEAVCVFEDFEHVGDVVRRFVGRFGVGYAVEVRSQNHPVAIVDSVFDALFHLCFSEPAARERFKRQSLQTVSVVVGIVVDKVVGGSHGESTEKVKPTFRLKVNNGGIAVLPFFFCLSSPY